jgi:hypothetical protein
MRLKSGSSPTRARPSYPMRRLGACLTLTMLVGLLAWWNWPRRIELSRNGYDLTIALYRVCNQQSEPGLEEIESKLDELRQASPASSNGYEIIDSLVSQARSGDWNGAMQKSREILDQQTGRP